MLDSMEGESTKRIFYVIAAGGLLIASVGCHQPAPGKPGPEVVYGGPRAPAAERIPLIEHPRYVREDQIYPLSVTQTLRWKGREAFWDFTLPPEGFSYAGFRFLKPHNLAEHRNKHVVRFRIIPASMAEFLWVALVDGDDVVPNLVVDLPMARYVKGRGSGAGRVSITLADFPHQGVTLQRTGLAAEVALEAPFDWNDVRGLRIINPGGKIPAQRVRITDLVIER